MCLPHTLHTGSSNKGVSLTDKGWSFHADEEMEGRKKSFCWLIGLSCRSGHPFGTISTLSSCLYNPVCPSLCMDSRVWALDFIQFLFTAYCILQSIKDITFCPLTYSLPWFQSVFCASCISTSFLPHLLFLPWMWRAGFSPSLFSSQTILHFCT